MASVQLAVENVNVELGVSDICTTLFKVVTLFATGVAGAAELAAAVEIAAGAAARL